MEQQPEVKSNSIGAWINETQDGRKYVSFTIDGKRYAMFKNDRKEEGSRQPDYNILPPREEIAESAIEDIFSS